MYSATGFSTSGYDRGSEQNVVRKNIRDLWTWVRDFLQIPNRKVRVFRHNQRGRYLTRHQTIKVNKIWEGTSGAEIPYFRF